MCWVWCLPAVYLKMYSLTVRVYSVRIFPPSLRTWGVRWDYNGRPYEWQRSVLSEPRRDWPGVVTELCVTRPVFRLYTLGNLPFHLSVPISSYILSTQCACHLVAAWAAPLSPVRMSSGTPSPSSCVILPQYHGLAVAYAVLPLDWQRLDCILSFFHPCSPGT